MQTNRTRLRAVGGGIGVVLSLCAIASGRQGNPSVVGEWAPLFPLPIVGVHAAVLRTGSVLLYGYQPPFGSSQTKGWLLAPDLTGVPADPSSNTFCGGGALLHDGIFLSCGGMAVLTPGGQAGIPNSDFFDPGTGLWTPGPFMADARWYPSTTVLADGRVLVVSGRDDHGILNPRVEILTPGIGWEVQVGAEMAIPTYPFAHLLPSGLVAVASSDNEIRLYEPATKTWTSVGLQVAGPHDHGASVLLPPTNAKVLILGGGPNPGFATSAVELLDFTGPVPTVGLEPPMQFARANLNAVLLPTGKVLVVGGGLEVQPNPCQGGPGPFVLLAEMFDPATSVWTPMAPMSQPRVYHSAAVLLPDARVLVVGSDCNLTGQIYSPPYLFGGPRPSILSSPAEARLGETIRIGYDAAAPIDSVVLARPGATTHAFDQEQRLVPLAFQTSGPQTLSATFPTNASFAPPGYYMLFLVDQTGVPSTAAFLRLRVLPTVDAVVPSTATPLGSGPIVLQGSNFSGATAVTIGGVALGTPGGFQVEDPSLITIPTAPVVPVLGPASLTVTSFLGTSDPASIPYVANDPPYLDSPSTASSAGSFEPTWAGTPGDFYALLFWIAPTTAPAFNVDILFPHIQLGAGYLPASNGVASLSIPLLGQMAGETFHTQVVTADLAAPGTPFLKVSSIRETQVN